MQGREVRIPTKAITIADKLLYEAQAAAILQRPIRGFDEYVSMLGIHTAALDYGKGKVRLPLARDMVVLGVAKVMATNNPEFNDLLQGIVGASRIVSNRYYKR